MQASTTSFVTNSAQVTVSIALFDVNNNAPVFSSPFYTGNVTEASNTMAPVVQLSCSDEDPTDTLTYTITGGLTGSYSTAFIVSSEGLIPQQELDYEDQAVFTLSVQCSDGASSPAVATVRVDVVPVNEFTPAFSVASYQFSSTAFIVSSEGLIIPQQELDYEDQAVFTLSVQCSDGASSPAVATVRVDVVPVNEFTPAFSVASYQ